MLLLVMSGLQCLGVEAVQPPQRKLGIVQPHLKRLGTKDSLPSPALVLSRRRDLAIRSSSRGEGADSPSRWLTRVRGGVQPAKSKSKVKATAPTATGNKIRYAGEAGTKQKVKEWYKATPIITRVQLSTSLLLTALGLVAIDPSYFLLDPVKIVTGLQLWRPFTAAAFMGPPSMSWVSNLYFLHQYGTALENSEGAAQQLVFLLFNIAVLSFLGSLIGLPVTSNALITAALHCLGRQDPLRDVNWMFAIKIKYWMLPFCLALVDMLQAQNPMAALPAALGILSGHLYYFLRNVWPQMGHRELLLAPEWWCKLLNRNNDDIIFRRDKRPLVGADGSAGGTGSGGSLTSILPKKKKSKIYKMKKTSS